MSKPNQNKPQLKNAAASGVAGTESPRAEGENPRRHSWTVLVQKQSREMEICNYDKHPSKREIANLQKRGRIVSIETKGFGASGYYRQFIEG